jgi:uncharacterized membrane protein
MERDSHLSNWIRLRRSFFAGLVVVLPLILSVVVLGWAFNWLTGWLPLNYRTPLYRLATLILLLVAITATGWVTRLMIGKKIHWAAEQVIHRVPVLNKVYAFFKEVSVALLGGKTMIFSRVVLIEYPKEGTFAMGFVTSETQGEIQTKTHGEVINVFLPTTPNPTSGFLLFVPREETIPLEMTVAEGMKLVVSGGSLVPVYPKVESGNTEI